MENEASQGMLLMGRWRWHQSCPSVWMKAGRPWHQGKARKGPMEQVFKGTLSGSPRVRYRNPEPPYSVHM
jgi:hypothetical protein